MLTPDILLPEDLRQTPECDGGHADLLEIIMRHYERFSALLTSNCPVEDCANC
jgi:hypothetical protein